MPVHKCLKEKEIKEIYTVSVQQAQQIDNMDKKMTEIYKMLMGNGRPGLLQDVQVIKAERNFVRYVLPVIVTFLATGASIIVAIIF